MFYKIRKKIDFNCKKDIFKNFDFIIVLYVLVSLVCTIEAAAIVCECIVIMLFNQDSRVFLETVW